MFGELLKDQFRVENFKLNHPDPQDFWLPCWQREAEVCLYWLFYRLCLAIYFLVTLLYAMTSFCIQPTNAGKEYKFLLFVTNWTFTVETVMFIMGLLLTVAAFAKQMKGQKLNAPVACKAYWVLYTTVFPPALLVTFGFWMWVYDGVVFPLNASNIILHVTNSAFLLLDFLLVAVPYRFLHFYMPLTYVFIYLTFSAIYELSGGTGVRGMKPIYTKLDWKYKPSESAVFAIAFVFGALALHTLASFLYVVKMWLRRVFILSQE